MECILHNSDQYNAIAVSWIPIFGILWLGSHCVALASMEFMEFIIRLSKLHIYRELPTSVYQKFWPLLFIYFLILIIICLLKICACTEYIMIIYIPHSHINFQQEPHFLTNFTNVSHISFFIFWPNVFK